ncbi:FMN-binding negative transcriptional regulator [Oleiagrimonas sp. MCCC 1A03011]|jgi:transcriptional regulator|uniref:FMN-binding negative transcriptional regulator n=1 Tax=Oleiagrimonas sp. MCCC 1A03011 TaxID=1926883 RepID=UPI000DC47CCA|nr:FMN-binding negative transcriptional regulator [Oleiagrimonas sp. MCCC 1A03011]RAP56395.1 transcriptional regulator [Oleiagrimonas sp. MCCC 1A03011]
MYQPKHFKELRAEALADVMLGYPFATVVHSDANGPQANPVPLLPGANGRLRGHVARGNPLAKADGERVLVIFHGPDAYVSPGWYPSKDEDEGRVVPTWNYATVQVHGRLRVTHDSGWLMRLLTDLTDRHELGMDTPWSVDDAPADYVKTQLKGIAGLDIEVERVEGKFKLSQNHPVRNRVGVIQGLRKRAGERDEALATLMLRYGKETSE